VGNGQAGLRALTAVALTAVALTAVALLGLVAAAGAAHAGTVKGFVRDESGQPLSGAQVLAVVDSSLLTMSDSLGAFVLSDVPPGLWTLQVTVPRYDLWS